MKYKVWVIPEKTMYYNAEQLTDGEWNLARLMQNKNCRTCYSVNKKDKSGTEIYTYDLIVFANMRGIVEEISNGIVFVRGENGTKFELPYIPSELIEVVGNAWELELDNFPTVE